MQIFWLPTEPWGEYTEAGVWLEIKGVEPSRRELAKLDALAKDTGHHARLVVGMPEPGETRIYAAHHSKGDGPSLYDQEHFLHDVHQSSEAGIPRFDWDWAMTAARSARFEFGESPSFSVKVGR